MDRLIPSLEKTRVRYFVLAYVVTQLAAFIPALLTASAKNLGITALFISHLLYSTVAVLFMTYVGVLVIEFIFRDKAKENKAQKRHTIFKFHLLTGVIYSVLSFLMAIVAYLLSIDFAAIVWTGFALFALIVEVYVVAKVYGEGYVKSFIGLIIAGVFTMVLYIPAMLALGFVYTIALLAVNTIF